MMITDKARKKKYYIALLRRDKNFEGHFIFGVKTTGVFCRPTCRARKPKPENVDFFEDVKEALRHGYRPCKICEPLRAAGEFPAQIKALLDDLQKNHIYRLGDSEIRRRGLKPHVLRRWFKKNHGLTFQAYLRSMRLGRAFGHLTQGGKVIDAAFDHGYESLSGFTEAFKKLTGSAPRLAAVRELIHVTRFPTPLGPMIAAAISEGLCLLEFTDRRGLEKEMQDLQGVFRAPMVASSHMHISRLQAQLSEYFQGKRKSFDVPVVSPGTPFQKKVWEELKSIPYGETRSYGEQAKSIGCPRGLRAVARANGQNRVCILIPCHRVIGADGSLTGYAGGLERKKFLIELERKNRG